MGWDIALLVRTRLHLIYYMYYTVLSFIKKYYRHTLFDTCEGAVIVMGIYLLQI